MPAEADKSPEQEINDITFIFDEIFPITPILHIKNTYEHLQSSSSANLLENVHFQNKPVSTEHEITSLKP